MSSHPEVVRVPGPGFETSQSVAMAAPRMPQPGDAHVRLEERGEDGGKGSCLHRPWALVTPVHWGLRGGVKRSRKVDGFCIWRTAAPIGKTFFEKLQIAIK